MQIKSDDIFNSVAIGNEAKCTGDSRVRLENPGTASIWSVGYTTFSDGYYKRIFRKVLRNRFHHEAATGNLSIRSLVSAKIKWKQWNGYRSKQAIAEKEKTIFSGFVAQEVEQAAKGWDMISAE